MNIPGEDTKKSALMRIFILAIFTTNILAVSYLYTSLAPATQSPQSYQQNTQEFIKQYNQKQEYFQTYSFFQNYDMIVLQNAKLNEDYKESINNFTNITQQEFYSLFQIVRKITTQKNFGEINRFGFNYTDWSRKEVVLRDQRGFNTSFIFSVLTSIQYRINKNSNSSWVSLSAQEIIDCCPNCMNSKRPQTVFQYIRQNGVFQEKQYPYQNSRFDTVPKKCRRSEKTSTKYYIQGYESVKNCAALEKAIKIGPVVVGLDGRNFPSYQYSIFKDCQRKTTHYATMVGISFDHWKLQNSWGRKWGERGYIRVNAGDTCGICLRGSYPVMKEI